MADGGWLHCGALRYAYNLDMSTITDATALDEFKKMMKAVNNLSAMLGNMCQRAQQEFFDSLGLLRGWCAGMRGTERWTETRTDFTLLVATSVPPPSPLSTRFNLGVGVSNALTATFAGNRALCERVPEELVYQSAALGGHAVHLGGERRTG